VDREHAPPLVVGEADERVERRLDRSAPERLLELLLRPRVHALGLPHGCDPGVVDPDVDRPEPFLDLDQRGVDRGAVADVRPDRDPVDPLRHASGGVLVHVEHRNARAVRAEPKTDRLADARAAAGHDRDLVLERHGTTTARPTTSPLRRRR
jgi:hypothetical protein